MIDDERSLELKNDNKKKLFLLMTILLIIVFILGISYALYEVISNGAKENTIQTGSITFLYTEDDNAINITNAIPVTDANGIISDNYFDFNVTGSGASNLKISYYVYFTVDETSTMDLNNVKAYLTNNPASDTTIENEVAVVNPTTITDLVPFNLSTLLYDSTSNNYLLYTNSFNFTNDTNLIVHYYRFRMWLSGTSSSSIIINGTGENDSNHQAILTGGTLKLKINIYAVNGDLNPIVKP